MKKTVALLGAGLLIPTLSIAGQPDIIQSNSHWYAGIGAGPTGFFNTVNTNNAGDADYGAAGVLGSLYAGYNHGFENKFNLGGEIFGDIRSANYADHDNYESPGYKAHLRYTYGVRILPGYQLNATTDIHLIVGYVLGNIHSTWGGTPSAVTSNFNGYQVGIGGGYVCHHRFGLRGDIIYSDYQTKTFTLGSTPFKNSPSSLDGLLSVIYAFS